MTTSLRSSAPHWMTAVPPRAGRCRRRLCRRASVESRRGRDDFSSEPVQVWSPAADGACRSWEPRSRSVPRSGGEPWLSRPSRPVTIPNRTASLAWRAWLPLARRTGGPGDARPCLRCPPSRPRDFLPLRFRTTLTAATRLQDQRRSVPRQMIQNFGQRPPAPVSERGLRLLPIFGEKGGCVCLTAAHAENASSPPGRPNPGPRASGLRLQIH